MTDIDQMYPNIWLWQCNECRARIFTRISYKKVEEFAERHYNEKGHRGTLLVNGK